MASKKMVWATGLLALAIILVGADSDVTCKFPAIYNFGDSNSDTGGRSAALVQVPPPNGETFFHKPSGRICDGRLIIDFIAEDLGLPYLSAYLDSIGTNFRHGANFATGGSSILPGGYSPFHLGIQISQFMQFKSRSTALYKHPGLRGLTDPFALCCGSLHGYHIECGKTAVVNGKLYGKQCHDPSSYVSWDGLHYTEASNKQIAKRIINGSLSTSPVAIRNACHSLQH